MHSASLKKKKKKKEEEGRLAKEVVEEGAGLQEERAEGRKCTTACV